MQITKLGHCCLVIETKGKKIVTDPGTFTDAQDSLIGVDIILITHEHADHFHLESVQKMLVLNPPAVVVTNDSVGKLLAVHGIAYTSAGGGTTVDVGGVTFEGVGHAHASIYETWGSVENTSYFIDHTFFMPGDAFCIPGKPVAVLALPVAGPWMRISDAITYLKAVHPQTAFGVHDGMLVQSFRGFPERLIHALVPDVTYVTLQDGETQEF